MKMVRIAYAPVLQAHRAYFQDLVSYRGYPTELAADRFQWGSDHSALPHAQRTRTMESRGLHPRRPSGS